MGSGIYNHREKAEELDSSIFEEQYHYIPFYKKLSVFAGLFVNADKDFYFYSDLEYDLEFRSALEKNIIFINVII